MTTTGLETTGQIDTQNEADTMTDSQNSNENIQLESVPQHSKVVPCLHGEVLPINSELIDNCFSAISIKYGVNDTNKSLQCRHSFFDLRRPEMSKIKVMPNSLGHIEQFLHKHTIKHGDFCDALHLPIVVNPEEPLEANNFRWIHSVEHNNKTVDGENEAFWETRSIDNMQENYAIEMTDEDLEPGEICHRSPAHFCIMHHNPTESQSVDTSGDKGVDDEDKAAYCQEYADHSSDSSASELLVFT